MKTRGDFTLEEVINKGLYELWQTHKERSFQK